MDKIKQIELILNESVKDIEMLFEDQKMIEKEYPFDCLDNAKRHYAAIQNQLFYLMKLLLKIENVISEGQK